MGKSYQGTLVDADGGEVGREIRSKALESHYATKEHWMNCPMIGPHCARETDEMESTTSTAEANDIENL